MKKHQIDNLFHAKLEDYQHIPSKDIWLKLQGNLESKKNNKQWLFLKIAAGLSLVALVTYALIFTIRNDKRIETNSNNISIQSDINNVIQKSNQESNELAENPNILKEQLIFKDPEKDQNLTVHQNTLDQIKQSDIATETIKAKGLELGMDHDLYFSELVINKVEVPVIDEQAAILSLTNDETVNKKPSVTITYVIGDQNQETIEEEDPKQSKLKKAWEFAKNVKNGEEKLPNFRELKNELLAFNKKKNKTQDNNN